MRQARPDDASKVQVRSVLASHQQAPAGTVRGPSGQTISHSVWLGRHVQFFSRVLFILCRCLNICKVILGDADFCGQVEREIRDLPDSWGCMSRRGSVRSFGEKN
jgi:hypothetical protein